MRANRNSSDRTQSNRPSAWQRFLIMGRLYPIATFENIDAGDILISTDELSEFEVHSKHDAVPEDKIPPEIVTIITKAERGGGLCGMEGIVYIMDGRLLQHVRIKQKARREP